MSLLDQLWDDTLAGPRPDSGLGKLRKQSSFGFRSVNSGDVTKESNGGNMRSLKDKPEKVTRSIMILKPPVVGDQSDTPPASPAGSTTPVSPASPVSGGGSFRFRRRSVSETYEKASGIGFKSPRPPYDI